MEARAANSHCPNLSNATIFAFEAAIWQLLTISRWMGATAGNQGSGIPAWRQLDPFIELRRSGDE
jgi:hypothetical protein